MVSGRQGDRPLGFVSRVEDGNGFLREDEDVSPLIAKDALYRIVDDHGSHDRAPVPDLVDTVYQIMDEDPAAAVVMDTADFNVHLCR